MFSHLDCGDSLGMRWRERCIRRRNAGVQPHIWKNESLINAEEYPAAVYLTYDLDADSLLCTPSKKVHD